MDEKKYERSIPTSTRHLLVRGAVILAATTLLTLGAVGFAAVGALQTATIHAAKGAKPHKEQLTITLAPGAAQSFNLPVADQPVEIQIDNYSTNGGVQTPSEVFSALANYNANGAGMSWVGTNNDGTQSAGNSFDVSSGPVTTETCGTSCVIATLSVSDAATGEVTLSTNPDTNTIDNTFVVDLWY